MKWTTRILGYLACILLGFTLCFVFLNWRWAPVFEQAERYGQLVEALRQFDEQHPGILGLGGSPNGLNQPPAPQEKIPAENKNEKGNDGKH